MKNVIISLVLMLWAFSGVGQQARIEPTIEVKGYQEKKVRPDVIYYSVSYIDPIYWEDYSEENTEDNNDRLRKLRALIDDPALSIDVVQLPEYEIHPSDGLEEEDEEYYETYHLVIHGWDNFEKLVATLQGASCFIGRIDHMDYSRANALNKELKQAAVMDAKETAEFMLSSVGAKIVGVSFIEEMEGEELLSELSPLLELLGREDSDKDLMDIGFLTFKAQVKVAFVFEQKSF